MFFGEWLKCDADLASLDEQVYIYSLDVVVVPVILDQFYKQT